MKSWLSFLPHRCGLPLALARLLAALQLTGQRPAPVESLLEGLCQPVSVILSGGHRCCHCRPDWSDLPVVERWGARATLSRPEVKTARSIDAEPEGKASVGKDPWHHLAGAASLEHGTLKEAGG
ncbi:hypothetical protein AAFF_G00363740 [Aldrovandia affinis]|uniref:Uncharacterized protein n=1 Tax=Aldrovandia affinis TaxID=143900 RepID=A0AAD7WMU7_9TELE|nr:hypothetical protein AAFF_G00363740 [Aldrovandia affinis]